MSSQNTLHRSKLWSASLLTFGMEGLIPRELIPVSATAVNAASSPRQAVDHQRIGMAQTCTVLYSIVVELVLKHTWEQEHEKVALQNHNVHGLFGQMRRETRCEVESLYELCCQEYRTVIGEGQIQHGAEIVAFDLANLEEALRWNEEAVKNLKYELTPRGKSVPTGIIWSPELLWIVPGNFRNFAIELTRWAVGRSEENSSP